MVKLNYVGWILFTEVRRQSQTEGCPGYGYKSVVFRFFHLRFNFVCPREINKWTLSKIFNEKLIQYFPWVMTFSETSKLLNLTDILDKDTRNSLCKTSLDLNVVIILIRAESAVLQKSVLAKFWPFSKKKIINSQNRHKARTLIVVAVSIDLVCTSHKK